MLLAKAPEAEMYDAEYLALRFGAALLLGAALYTVPHLLGRNRTVEAEVEGTA
jgi:hypothetical protein